MLKVIAILSLLLTLVSGYSYTQHLKSKAKDVEIATQLDMIKVLTQEVKDKKEQLEIERGMSNVIVTDTRTSDTSFNSLVNKINTIDCSPKREVKSDENIKKSNTPTIVSEYYNVLRSAYSLQNKD